MFDQQVLDVEVLSKYLGIRHQTTLEDALQRWNTAQIELLPHIINGSGWLPQANLKHMMP